MPRDLPAAVEAQAVTQFDLFDAERAPARQKAPTGTSTPPARRKRVQAPPATENQRIPAKCPVLGKPVCRYSDCRHYQGDRCTHPEAKLGPRRRRVLMHVYDAGNNTPDGRDVARWRCSRCGHETDWVPAPNTRRPPCPKCN